MKKGGGCVTDSRNSNRSYGIITTSEALAALSSLIHYIVLAFLHVSIITRSNILLKCIHIKTIAACK